VGGPQRVGGMYRNLAARLRLIEDVGMCKPTLPRTEETRHNGGCVLESGRAQWAVILINDASAGLLSALRPIPTRGIFMAATDTLSSNPPASTPSDSGSNQPLVPPKIAALLAGLTAATGAVIGLMTSFNAVHWTSGQTTLVATEVAAFWALASVVTAHLWPQTKKQPVAVAGTVTAFVSATLALGIGFAWWQLTQSQNASLISLVAAIVAVVSALAARSTVEAGTTPAP